MLQENLKYTLAPYMKMAYFNNQLELGFGSIKKSISEIKLQMPIIELCRFLESPKTFNEIRHLFESQFSLKDSEIEKVLEMFSDNNFLLEDGIYDREERYSRHKLFYNMSGAEPSKVQKNLFNKHISIVGCGGIGNLISVNLATAGIGKLTLIDQDVIEISNLTRQILFSESDVGLPKAKILARELKKRASNIEVETVENMVDTPEKAKNLLNGDLIIISGDSPGIAALINEACYQKNIPFLNVGYIQDIAVWGPFFIPGKTPCYECFSKNNIANIKEVDELLKQKVKSINKRYQSPSIGPVNMLSASLASLDVLKMLGEFGEVHASNKRIGVWTHSLEIEEQVFRNDQYCKRCAI